MNRQNRVSEATSHKSHRRRLATFVCAVSAMLGMASLLSLPAAAQKDRGIRPPRIPKKHPDFNGDGIADLAVGAPGERIAGSGFHRGAVHVVYGWGGGLAWAKNQFWYRTTGNLALGYGAALAWGDFNKDGYDDLAIGAPDSTNMDGLSGVGSVDILYGSKDGLTEVRHQIWNRDVLFGTGSGKLFDRFGSALAVGDFNGDGYADLSIAVLSGDHSNSDRPDRPGSVHILYGSLTGLSYSGAFAPLPQTFNGLPGVASLAAGDFNKDGRADLAVGVPGTTVNDREEAGSVHVLYGTATGLKWLGIGQFWTQDSPYVLGTAEAGDHYGSSLAAGDFNADGYLDLAIGAAGENSSSGVVHILHGSPGGLSALKVPGIQIWSQNEPGIGGEARANERFGGALATGDFNGDGCADLAIGAPGESDQRGVVHILYGSRSFGLTPLGNQIWSQDSPDVLGGAEYHDRFGASLVAADFNRSGHDDLAVGVPGENSFSGAVNVLFGSRFGLSAVNNQILMEQFQGLQGSAMAGNVFGYVNGVASFSK